MITENISPLSSLGDKRIEYEHGDSRVELSGLFLWGAAALVLWLLL